MSPKHSLPRINLSLLVVVLLGALGGVSCGSSTNTASGQTGSNSELEGPIETLSPATGTPTQLTIYGVDMDIGAAVIEFDVGNPPATLSPLDLAPTQFVEVEFIAFPIASEVEVEEAEAEGTLLNLVTFAPPATVTVNRNSRTIDATFTVLDAGILCDNNFTRVELNDVLGDCDDLTVSARLEVEGLVVDDFTLSLADLSTTVPSRDVLLAAEIESD